MILDGYSRRDLLPRNSVPRLEVVPGRKDGDTRSDLLSHPFLVERGCEYS